MSYCTGSFLGSVNWRGYKTDPSYRVVLEVKQRVTNKLVNDVSHLSIENCSRGIRMYCRYSPTSPGFWLHFPQLLLLPQLSQHRFGSCDRNSYPRWSRQRRERPVLEPQTDSLSKGVHPQTWAVCRAPPAHDKIAQECRYRAQICVVDTGRLTPWWKGSVLDCFILTCTKDGEDGSSMAMSSKLKWTLLSYAPASGTVISPARRKPKTAVQQSAQIIFASWPTASSSGFCPSLPPPSWHPSWCSLIVACVTETGRESPTLCVERTDARQIGLNRTVLQAFTSYQWHKFTEHSLWYREWCPVTRPTKTKIAILARLVRPLGRNS